MKTSLLFLGALSAVFVGVRNIDDLSFAAPETTSISWDSESSEPATWKLSISDSASNCTTSFVSDSKKSVKIKSGTNCAKALPGLQKIATIRTNANGDIILYSKDGTRLAQFMESETLAHESIWPQYPLMTLARVD